MLGKLLKQEFRATGRIMLPVFGALLILSVLANFSIRVLDSSAGNNTGLRILAVLVLVFFGAAIFGALIVTLWLMVTRFYRNLLKDEGYLMHTLPVSVHELIWAKLIVSLVWFVATALLIFLVMSLTAFNLMNTNLEMIIEGFPSWAEIRQFLSEAGVLGRVTTLFFQGLLAVVLGTLSTCLHFYAAMSLGHMFTKNKILLSVVFFVGFSFAFNMMEMAYGAVGFSLFDSGPMAMTEFTDGLRFVSTITWHGIILSAIQGAVLYLATVLGLKRGLNLE